MYEQPARHSWRRDRLKYWLILMLVLTLVWMGLTIYRNHERIVMNTETLATIESFRATEEAE